MNGNSLPEMTSAEMRLLLLSARTELPEGKRPALLELLQADLSWGKLWEAGHFHGVLPLLYLHLQALTPQLVPVDMLERLRFRHDTSVHRNLLKTAEFLRIVQALAGKDIPTIPLKGVVLAHTLYPNPGLREFSDIDVLVRDQDVWQARGLLESMGFVSRSDLAAGQEIALRRSMHAHVFWRPADRMLVDLHWDLAPRYQATGIPVDALWHRTTKFELGGAELRILSPEVTLLLLCAHAANHGPVPWPRVKWVCDVSELLRKHRGLDWRELFALAEEAGCRRMVDLGLAVAARLLDAPLPDEVERRVRSDQALAPVAALVCRRLLEDRRDDVTGASRLWMSLRLRERRRDRLSCLTRQAFVPREQDWSVARLPPALAFLYVPLRLLRLAFKFGLSQPLRWLGAKLRKQDSHAEAAITREAGST